MGSTEEPEKRVNSFLSEVVSGLSLAISCSPILASAITSHLFQILIRQFYENGRVYLPNFGWLIFEDGEVVFSKSAAMCDTANKMHLAEISEKASLALINERVLKCQNLRSGADSKSGSQTD